MREQEKVAAFVRLSLFAALCRAGAAEVGAVPQAACCLDAFAVFGRGVILSALSLGKLGDGLLTQENRQKSAVLRFVLAEMKKGFACVHDAFVRILPGKMVVGIPIIADFSV